MADRWWGQAVYPSWWPSLTKDMQTEHELTRVNENLDGLERNDFCNFDKPRKRDSQIGKIESNEQSKEGGQPKLIYGKGRDARRSQSFREINSSEDRPRPRPGFVKPIRNGLRKEQNLIKCRSSRAETGLAGRKNGIRF